jgi:hypothetical protein
MNDRERRNKHHAHDGAAADAVSRSMFPILARGLIDFGAVAPVLPRQSHHRIVQLGLNCQHAIGRWWEWAEKPVLPTGKPQSQSFYSSLLPTGGANLRGTPKSLSADGMTFVMASSRISCLGAHMGEVVQFIAKREVERARLIEEARAIYERIFPTEGPAGLQSRT